MSIFPGKVGGWKDVLTSEQNSEFDEWITKNKPQDFPNDFKNI